MIRKHLNISVGFIAIFSLLLFSCKAESNQEKVLGVWEFQEMWSPNKNGTVASPNKSNSKYQQIQELYKDGLFKDYYIFYSKDKEGLLTKKGGDTLRAFPYHFINDSTYKWNYIELTVRFEDNNHLLVIQRTDPDLVKQGMEESVDISRYVRVK